MAQAKSKPFRRLRSRTAKDWEAELTALQPDLKRIAAEYKQWLVREAGRASAASERADIKKLVEISLAFGVVWHKMGERAQADVRARLLDQGHAGQAFVSDVERDLHRIASAAIAAQLDIPRRGWPSGARQRATRQLRELFVERRLPFTAHSSEYGGVSLAVACLQKIVARASEPLAAGAARKLIEDAKK